MNKLKLGFIAIALLGAAVAFAQDSKNGWYHLDETTPYPDAEIECPAIPNPDCAYHFTDDMQDGVLFQP